MTRLTSLIGHKSEVRTGSELSAYRVDRKRSAHG